MVRHIVFMKFPEFSLAQIAKEKLLSMKGNVEVLKEIEVGIDFSRSERSYDLALVTTFESKEDLETYRVHPYHQEIVQWLKEVGTQTKVVDYEL
ncbi:MAG: stress responsive protein [Nitratiruptor sp.]|nr:stress responsive protein [Nitratiruptor sp.]NPA83801.1 Dabb family protein [Campylobacterota bacterium]